MPINKKEKIVGSACVGCETILSPKHTLRFAFHNFEELPHERGKKTSSPFLTCHGYLWRLELFPGGDEDSDTETTYVSLYLQCKDPKNKKDEVKINYAIRLDDLIKNEAKAAAFDLNRGTGSGWKNIYKAKAVTFNLNEGTGRGWQNFQQRKSVLGNHLHNQALIVKVDVEIYMKKEEIWTPSKSNISGKLLNMLRTGKASDITFIVGGEIFTSHKVIISMGAPGLWELADDSINNNEIIIDNVDPSIFCSFLQFLYTNNLPPGKELNRNNARDMLNIANKFGCTELKLHAEAWLVMHDINETNVLELLLFADAMCCPLLKEKATQYFIAHSSVIMSTTEWKELKKTNIELFADLMESIYSHEHLASTDQCSEETVSSLRRKLEEKGLDVDGTREMLVNRLKTSANE